MNKHFTWGGDINKQNFTWGEDVYKQIFYLGRGRL